MQHASKSPLPNKTLTYRHGRSVSLAHENPTRPRPLTELTRLLSRHRSAVDHMYFSGSSSDELGGVFGLDVLSVVLFFFFFFI